MFSSFRTCMYLDAHIRPPMVRHRTCNGFMDLPALLSASNFTKTASRPSTRSPRKQNKPTKHFTLKWGQVDERCMRDVVSFPSTDTDKRNCQAQDTPCRKTHATRCKTTMHSTGHEAKEVYKDDGANQSRNRSRDVGKTKMHTTI